MRRASDHFSFFLHGSLSLTVTSAFGRWTRLTGECAAGARGVSVRSHYISGTPDGAHPIEFQGGGASVLDKALVSETVAHALSHSSRSCSVGMVDLSCKSFHLSLWSAWPRATGEWCRYVRSRRLSLACAFGAGHQFRADLRLSGPR